MEAAFVYGTMYQFVLTTEIALLESIGYVQEAYVNNFKFASFTLLTQHLHETHIVDLPERNCKQIWIYKWNQKSPSLLLSVVLQSENDFKYTEVMLG